MMEIEVTALPEHEWCPLVETKTGSIQKKGLFPEKGKIGDDGKKYRQKAFRISEMKKKAPVNCYHLVLDVSCENENHENRLLSILFGAFNK